ncbi:MAG: putative lipid II flippase FtsW [Candidatus Komeilibacteria bacterium CG10_big_fil_rev_8_21_14_0_10_41_13]|uniref:Probable peptidoglycan glycosyltransferase FtsW n=1 Tax=Candidatus Komeilibacteria bacterium CG10_big_fil_rev_8_21_14_0_10_41_13 TaxID=1974476 RepID=A0A2M6WD45_9BACT|nr:MAG: putative lipid II flippase FtsW [Candidatus Komeilibacteria bacterium CG10_big_fil_rev_8_21_14_0_10_41_13]
MRQKSLKEDFKKILLAPFGFKYYHHAPDYILIGALGLILLFGLIMLSSASSVAAFQKFGDSYYFFKHQLLNGLIPGIIGFFIASQIDYRIWKKYAFAMLVISVVLLVLVFIPGIGEDYGKAHSWISVGPIGFQPTEIVKMTFLIYLASWLEKKGARGLKDVEYGFLPFLFALGLIIVLVMAQPDLGTLLVIIAISFFVYFIAGAPYKHILGLIIGGLILLFISIQVAPYRLARLTAFFKPEIDPQGISYHITQAKLAVGSGGFIGLGIGKSRQKFNYLPEVYGDSIFAIIAEEMGFIFSIILILLFLTLVIRGLKIARGSPDDFAKLLAAGITVWFAFQAFINIATMVGLFPLTGIPLPFISYGGTAMAISMLAVGILINISKQTKNI